MVLFGIAMGVLIAFLGGLMAVDIVPRKATGAALGVVGMASYAAAGLQELVSGWLIGANKVKVTQELSAETKAFYQNIIDTANVSLVEAGDKVEATTQHISSLKPQLLDLVQDGQVPQKFGEAGLKWGNNVDEAGEKFTNAIDGVSDKVVEMAQKALEEGSVVVETYDFTEPAIFWVGASVISFLLPLLLSTLS